MWRQNYKVINQSFVGRHNMTRGISHAVMARNASSMNTTLCPPRFRDARCDMTSAVVHDPPTPPKPEPELFRDGIKKNRQPLLGPLPTHRATQFGDKSHKRWAGFALPTPADRVTHRISVSFKVSHLIHAGSPTTPECLPPIVARAPRRGGSGTKTHP